MSDNPVFDTVQALYPDVHIPDLLVPIHAWGRKEAIRHVLEPKDTVRISGIVINEQPDNDFPAHVYRGPGPAAGATMISDRQRLRSPKHGR